MKRCSEEARRRCQDREHCGDHAIFADGSECDQFNEAILRESFSENDYEDYWCERCCNFDKENIGMDATAICRLTGRLTYCQEYGGDCKGFNVPAADVAEVRRGEWIITKKVLHSTNPCMDDDYYIRVECSECDLCVQETRGGYPTPITTNHCPNCGAKMDGKGEGE